MHLLIPLSTIFISTVFCVEVDFPPLDFVGHKLKAKELLQAMNGLKADFPPLDFAGHELKAKELLQAMIGLKASGITLKDVENAFPFLKFLKLLKSRPNDLEHIFDEIGKSLTYPFNTTGITISPNCAVDLLQIAQLSKPEKLRRKALEKVSMLKFFT